MKKTIDLLNEVVAMGFSRERAFSDIDASLDEELGLENTNFKNSHGLDEDEHYTSAYDLATISAEAMK